MERKRIYGVISLEANSCNGGSNTGYGSPTCTSSALARTGSNSFSFHVIPQRKLSALSLPSTSAVRSNTMGGIQATWRRGSSSEASTELAKCPIPAYCLKSLGSRHLLVAGGGGAVRTGVRNEIELFLLTYNELATTAGGGGLSVRRRLKDHQPVEASELEARQTAVISTDIYANMNMDAVCLEQPEAGKYLIAVGQDQYCALYQSTGFTLSALIEQEGGEGGAEARRSSSEGLDPAFGQEATLEAPFQLALRFKAVSRLVTDHRHKEPYQECVKFFHSPSASSPSDPASLLMATGGADGHIRVWRVAELMALPDSRQAEEGLPPPNDAVPELVNDAEPLMEFRVGQERVEDMDVSHCGQLIAAIGKEGGTLWRHEDGHRVAKLANPPQLDPEEFKPRSVRFLNLDRSGRNVIFIAAYNKKKRTGKQVSHLALWAFSKEERTCHLISSKVACHEMIACLAVSECSNLAAVGTMAGSIGIYNVHDLSHPLLFTPNAHRSFVTAVEFLPRRSYDTAKLAGGRVTDGGADEENDDNESTVERAAFARKPSLRQGASGVARCFLPGVCSDSRCAVVSLSVDQSIRLHRLPFPKPASTTVFIMKLAVSAFLLYLLLWLFFVIWA